MNKILILWDKSHQLEDSTKRDSYFQHYIVTRIQHTFFETCEWTLVDEEEFILIDHQINDKLELNRYDAILVLLSYQWKNLVGKLNGLELVRAIRTKAYKQPIFVWSESAKSKLYEINDQLIGLLKTPGTYLINSRSFEVDLKSEDAPQGISDKLLQDILYYTGNKIGFLEEIIHRTKNQLLRVDWDGQNISEYLAIFEHTQSIITPCYKPQIQAEVDAIFEAIYAQLGKSKLSPSELFYQKKVDLIALLDKKEESSSELLADWHVLFIDDDEHIRNKVQQQFEQKGMVCHVAADASETFSILSDDLKGQLRDNKGNFYPANSINVVVSDYRFENSLGEWDACQGYDIIDYIHRKTHNWVSFFILTSKKGAITHQARKNSAIKISWHAKDDVLDAQSSFDLFFDQVYLEGEKTYDALCGKPKTTSWHKASTNLATPLKDYYRYYRNLGDYAELEQEINRDVTTYLEEVDYEIAQLERDTRVKTPDIEIDLNEIHFNTEFKAKIEDEPREAYDTNMQKFVTKLKGRRIALALASEKYTYTSDQIIALLKFGKTDPEDEDYMAILNENKRREIEDNGLPVPKEEKQLLPTHLNLSKRIEKDIPLFILPEEISFLEQEVGIPIVSREERRRWYKVNMEIERVCREIYKSNTEKYKSDSFLEKPPKVYSENELMKVSSEFLKKFNHKLVL